MRRGDMWKSKLNLIDESIELTLTDFSENMVSIARSSLGEQRNISYGVANSKSLPYTYNSFDIIIANMTLHNVKTAFYIYQRNMECLFAENNEFGNWRLVKTTRILQTPGLIYLCANI